MLVITRKPRENIVIGNTVVVEVLGIHHGEITIGITNPTSLATAKKSGGGLGHTMSVVRCKARQTIPIRDDVAVNVVRIVGRQAQLGVEAPDGIRIRRGELEPEGMLQKDRQKRSRFEEARITSQNPHE